MANPACAIRPNDITAPQRRLRGFSHFECRAWQILAALALAGSAHAQTTADTTTITIRAATILDGRGGVIKNGGLIVRGGKIIAVTTTINPRDGKATYDLGNATVLPGLVDAHVHPGWYINKQGALHNGRDGDTPAQSALARAGNLYETLMSGVTTIQSLGGAEDLELREAVARGALPGPRILTSLGQISNRNLTVDSLRGLVRAYKARGADVIKLFASAGLQNGGEQTLSDDQLRAVCGEATSLGLRSVVHAISAQSVRAATLAGCTEIDHGTFATDDELRLMGERGTIFDPQVCLVFQNYLDHRDVYGRSGYTTETFDSFDKALPVAAAMFKRALATPKLKIIYGTDAVALAHGRNVEELICRVRAGQKPMDAIVSATSASAAALGIGDVVGTLAPGMQADIIAVRGDPAKDVGALKSVVFVMKGGRVY